MSSLFSFDLFPGKQRTSETLGLPPIELGPAHQLLGVVDQAVANMVGSRAVNGVRTEDPGSGGVAFTPGQSVFANLPGQDYATLATEAEPGKNQAVERAIDGVFGGRLSEYEENGSHTLDNNPETAPISVATARALVQESIGQAVSPAVPPSDASFLHDDRHNVTNNAVNLANAIAGNPSVPTLPVPDGAAGLTAFEEQVWAANQVQGSRYQAGAGGAPHV